ncbi:hypothetical protein J6590_083529 [Homalodisca vitripennis]|nr:hypothetical protein J6590_083529 [Homalodisca vitripennis]
MLLDKQNRAQETGGRLLDKPDKPLLKLSKSTMLKIVFNVFATNFLWFSSEKRGMKIPEVVCDSLPSGATLNRRVNSFQAAEDVDNELRPQHALCIKVTCQRQNSLETYVKHTWISTELIEATPWHQNGRYSSALSDYRAKKRDETFHDAKRKLFPRAKQTSIAHR